MSTNPGRLTYGDDQFPFSYLTLVDPIGGRTGGILQPARYAGVCPKVLHFDTECDFWQARSSLIATDPGGADIAMPDEVRIYAAIGVPHAPFRPLTRPVMQLSGKPLGYRCCATERAPCWPKRSRPRWPSSSPGTPI